MWVSMIEIPKATNRTWVNCLTKQTFLGNKSLILQQTTQSMREKNLRDMVIQVEIVNIVTFQVGILGQSSEHQVL